MNEWHSYSDKVKAKFILIESETNQPTNHFKEGNLIKIDIPGPRNPSGSGFDWTKIIDI